MFGMSTGQFSTVDYVVFASNIILCLAVGGYYATVDRKKSSMGQFLLGGRNLSSLPLTISLIASVISAVTILGIPAEMYTQGTQYVFNIGSGIGIVLTAVIFVPLLYPLKMTSMFEYLEKRFQSRATRIIGSVFEILGLLLYGSTALLAPVYALGGVTFVPSAVWTILLGVIVITYTSLGGLKAVIWTDVLQASIMIIGIIVIIVKGCLDVGGLGTIIELNRQGDRFHFYSFDLDPTVRHTFWALSIGFGFGSLSFYGASQFTFQRIAASKTLADAKKTVLWNLPFFYVFHLLLCFIGMLMYAYYALLECDPLKSGRVRSADQILPLFVLDIMQSIPGLTGLFVACLTSGALSTLSSVLNSIAALVWEDLLKNTMKQISSSVSVLLVKLTVIISGILMILLSFAAANFGPHVFQVCFSFLGATGGPQLGMFLLGGLVPWANSAGAIAGCICGLLMTTWVMAGAYVNKAFSPGLPAAPTGGCPQFNITNIVSSTSSPITAFTPNWNISEAMLLSVNSTPSTQFPVIDFSPLYRLSYTWYSLLGAGTCIFVGTLVSLLTGKSSCDENLVLHWYEPIIRIFNHTRQLCCNICKKETVAVNQPFEDVNLLPVSPQLTMKINQPFEDVNKPAF